MEKFYRAYLKNLVFRQHQGALQGDEGVGDGVCSALTYEWVKQNMTGTYSVQNWTRENPLFRKFAVPEDTPIGRRFPATTNVRVGMTKVPPGMALKQKIAQLSLNNLGIERNFELLAQRDGRRVALVSKYMGFSGGGGDVGEQIEKHHVRFRQGYGLIGITEPKGHAVACQIAGSINRYYDPNLGEFCFSSMHEFLDAFALMWEIAEYKYRNLHIWTMY